MFIAVEIEKLYKEGKIKEDNQLIRIWKNGHKSLGILMKSNLTKNLSWKALEDYNGVGGCTKGKSYSLGDYNYTTKILERKRKLNKL